MKQKYLFYNCKTLEFYLFVAMDKDFIYSWWITVVTHSAPSFRIFMNFDELRFDGSELWKIIRQGHMIHARKIFESPEQRPR